MKRVALLAYYFPPLGGAGVQRAVKLAQYLPAFGWEPVVVTGPANGGGRWTPQDESLVGRTMAVERVPGPEPARGGRAERWLRRPSAWTHWWVNGAREALAGLNEIDVIVATLSPFEGVRAAADAAAALGVPWVADLRDPWALDEMTVYPSRAHRAAELRTMRQALAHADAIVMNTEEARAALVRAAPELSARLCVTIPNGFDPADLDVTPEPRDDSAFRIVHTGYLHTELASKSVAGALRRVAGGTLDGARIDARSHRYLIEAIDRLRVSDPRIGNKIELHLAGVLSAADAALAARPYVRQRGYLSHDMSVALARSADLLFLPMHDLPPGRRARIVPGKTYEYLAAGRPILAAVPDGDARDLLARAENALLVRPRDVPAIAAALRAVALGNAKPSAARADVIAPYMRRELTKHFAAVLDELGGAQSRASAA